MKKILTALALVLIVASQVEAQQNPCLNTDRVKSVLINIFTVTTASIVSNTIVDQGIYVCGFTITVLGSTPAQQVVFLSGTGSNCAVITTNIAIFLGSTTAGVTQVINSHPQPFAKIAAGNGLCIVTSQAANINGVLSYVIF